MASKKQIKKKETEVTSDSDEESIIEAIPVKNVVEDDENVDEDEDDVEYNDYGEEVISNDGLNIEDNKEEIENCYFQYDNLIDEYEDLGQATRVPDEERITLNKLTKYEMVRILGIRAHQISVNAKTLVKNIEGKSPVEIAIYELKTKMTPFKVRRPLPNNTYEIWKIKELDVDISENEETSLINSFN